LNAISKDPQEIAELDQAMMQPADAMGEDERIGGWLMVSE